MYKLLFIKTNNRFMYENNCKFKLSHVNSQHNNEFIIIA
ncbi:protein of unknown function [Cardinium endosymbiont cEper1 of Encarsia pergandiella]|nr:protein of unknown function [Cardinium endosymbiont cEper1 of Encarsia pergandiella]